MSLPPSLNPLLSYCARHGFRFRVEPGPAAFAALEARDLVLEAPAVANPWRFTAFDEYGDAQSANPSLCLALLDFEFAALDEAEDRAAWARAQGLDPAAPDTLALHARNKVAYAEFLRRFGPVPNPVTPLDWQLNAGLAQSLREGG